MNIVNYEIFFGIKYSFDNCHSLSISWPYILDFDLDFFTITDNHEHTHGWTEKVMIRHFPHLSNQDQFIRFLIENATVITICREPDYCGSIGDSSQIPKILDDYYFDGALGTHTTL